jgi:hypothetical protein
MKFLKKKERVVAILAVAALAIAAVGAYAYWTTTGSGDGTFANASSNGTVTLHATWNANALYPGGSQPVTFTADNAGDSNLFVGVIHADSITASDPLCDTADFSMADVTSNSVVNAGASGAPVSGTGTLVFANTAANQDHCKGAAITLNLTSN